MNESILRFLMADSGFYPIVHCLPFRQTSIPWVCFLGASYRRNGVPTAVAIDFLDEIIVFDPYERTTASKALTFPLAPYYDPTDGPEAANTLDWRSIKNDRLINIWKAKVHAKKTSIDSNQGTNRDQAR